MIYRFLKRRFEAAGSAYPLRATVAVLSGGHVIVLLGVLLLDIQVSFTRQQLIETVILAEILMGIDNVISALLLRRALDPVEQVIDDPQASEREVLSAWRILVSLPSRHFVRALQRSSVITLLPLVVWTTEVTGLSWWGAPLIYVAGGVIMVYGYLLRFLVFEIAYQPVVRSFSDRLPDAIEGDARVIGVREKLLLGIPTINVITGSIVAALSGGEGSSGLANIGADVIVVVIVATFVSLGLSLLMSRSLLIPVAQLDRAAERARQGDFSVRVPVMSGDEIGELTGGFNLLMAGMQQRGRLEEALSDYVDPTVAEAVVEEDEEKLDGSELDLTCMFVDIRGFTSYAEGAAPGEVVSRLNDFFDVVIPIVTSHGGQPNKFLGDGLLALFGAPKPLSGHADHAVDAALEIVSTVRARFGGRVDVTIGINSGPAVAGRVGGGGKFDFTVVGDTVNTAQRVERATRETGDAILLAGATRSRLTRDHGGFKERSSVPMSGKSERVRLWAPVAVLEAIAGLAAGDLSAVAHAAPEALPADISLARKRRRG